MILKDMLAKINVKSITGLLDKNMQGLTYDSRKVKPGFLFICIEGYKTDGHQFVDNAISDGAIAIVANRQVSVPEGVTLVIVEDTRKALALLAAAFYGYPAQHLTMIGVTGTNGKTTTTHFIAELLEKKGNRVGLIGTIKNKIGDRELPVTNTTPESLELQALFKDMTNSGINYAVMEVSSHALYLDRVYGTEFDIALFTNITQDHLDFHENMERYFAAKVKLFANLDKNSIKKHPKFAIINKDDKYWQRLADLSRGRLITYSAKQKADIMGQNIKIGPSGVSFDVICPQGQFSLKLKMTGMFSVYNSLAAVAVALLEGVSIPEIKEVLERIKGVAGRFELVDEGQDFSVIVDYAHTPDSLENVLKTSRQFVQGRLITVFGCGGDRDRTKRPIMGRVVAKYSDFFVITSDNPRTENPMDILNQIEAGVATVAEKYTVIPDRREAIKYAIEMACSGDIVMIAGKGHETYQIVGDQVLPFDDKEEARKVLHSIRR